MAGALGGDHADVDAGRVPVSYRLVRNPPLAEAISLRVKTGSSRWWLQIQALDHGNPIARFEALHGPAGGVGDFDVDDDQVDGGVQDPWLAPALLRSWAQRPRRLCAQSERNG